MFSRRMLLRLLAATVPLKAAALLTTAVLLAAPLSAQPSPCETGEKKWASWQFQGENDALAVFSGSDRFYTNGLRFSWLRCPGRTPEWAREVAQRIARKLTERSDSDVSFGFAFGQNVYTPSSIDVVALQADDRPYAAWLYGSLLLQVTDARRRIQHSVELQLGIVGPEAGGEFVQSELHELIDDEPPLGWDNQLALEPAANLLYLWRRRYVNGSNTLDFIPHLGGSLGTVATFVNAGGTVRLGWNLSGFPQPQISPAIVAPRGERPRWEFYVSLGVDGRAVARNLFLDGNTFKDSHSVDKEAFVYDLKAGFSIRRKAFRFEYVFVRRSEEFEPPPPGDDGIHDFGSFTLSVERRF